MLAALQGLVTFKLCIEAFVTIASCLANRYHKKKASTFALACWLVVGCRLKVAGFALPVIY